MRGADTGANEQLISHDATLALHASYCTPERTPNWEATSTMQSQQQAHDCDWPQGANLIAEVDPENLRPCHMHLC